MANEKASFQIMFEDGPHLDKTIVFTAYENTCRHGSSLDIEIVSDSGEEFKVSEIPEYQLRQLVAYLNASLTEHRR